MTPRLCGAFAVSAVCFLHSTWGHAQSNWADKASSAQLLEDAAKLMAAGDFAGACPKYDESQRRSPDLDTLLKLADCYDKAGKSASAWGAFKEAIEIASRRHAPGASDPKEESARARAAALEPKLSRLMITVIGADTPGLEVYQGAVLVGRGAWGSAMPVDPGAYQVMAKAPGKKTWSQAIQVAANGAKVDVMVPALENESAAPVYVPPGAPPYFGAPVPPESSRAPVQGGATWTSQRTVGFIVGGIGIATLGVGTMFALMSASKVSERDDICPTGMHCTPEEAFRIRDLTYDAKADATRSQVALILGAIAVGGGAALVLTAPRQVDGVHAVRVAPWVGTASAGVTMGGKW